MAAENQAKGKLTLAVPRDIIDFVKLHGGARKTDLALGKLNVSEEVTEYIRRLIAKVSPESIGYALLKEKEELRGQLAQIDERAQELFGVSTIEEWAARAQAADHQEADGLRKQLEIRKGVKADVLREMETAYRKYEGNGSSKSRHHQLAWIRNRFRDELRTVGISAEQFLAQVKRDA